MKKPPQTLNLRKIKITRPWLWPEDKKEAPVNAVAMTEMVQAQEPDTYLMETAASIANHKHEHPFKGHTAQWYEFGGSKKCPTCDAVPEFEAVTLKPINFGRGPLVKLTSGERVNR